MKGPYITCFCKRIIVPENTVVFIRDKKRNGNFCIVLKKCHLLPAIIHYSILVLPEAIPCIIRSGLESLGKIVITLPVENGRPKVAACNWFFTYYFFAFGIPKRNSTCVEINYSSYKLCF